MCDAEGKPIPTELRREEQALRHNIELEDDNTAVPRSHIDDEYAHAGERDPKVFITTSRDPSSRLTQFAKELKLVVPNAQRINRGGQVMVLPVHAPQPQQALLKRVSCPYDTHQPSLRNLELLLPVLQLTSSLLYSCNGDLAGAHHCDNMGTSGKICIPQCLP